MKWTVKTDASFAYGDAAFFLLRYEIPIPELSNERI